MLLPETATGLELVVALLGIAGVGLSAWMVADDIWDLRLVARDGVVGGPRWLSARGHLGLNAALLAFWLGYTVVAFIAVHLPARDDNGVSWSLIASWARLEFGMAVMTGQIFQRVTRTLLRRLPRAAWDAFFGEAALWRDRYLASQADLHEVRATTRHLEAEVAYHRGEKHDALNLATRRDLRLQQLQRWLKQEGIVPPDFGGAPLAGEDT